jgi:hypothetical protein
VPAAGRLPALQRRAARRIGHLHVSYARGPLAEAGRGRGELRPGHRIPDLEVVSGGQVARLYKVLRGGRHVLLAPGAGLPRGLQAWQDQIDVVAGGAGAGGRICLVRPDGYVAARGSVTRIGPVLGYLRRLSGSTPALVMAEAE